MRETEANQPWEATRRGIADLMGEIDGALPGSIVVRYMPCGKPGCACKADPPALHGPYIQWTRSVNGKTVTKFLSEDQLARYQPWFDNARRLKELTARLQIASVHAVEISEGWATQTQAASLASTSTPVPRPKPPRRAPR